jgi:hypothetical protein
MYQVSLLKLFQIDFKDMLNFVNSITTVLF